MNLATLRQFVETDLPDAPLQMTLDAAEEELASRFGGATAAVEVVLTSYQRLIFLKRKAMALTSVVERLSDGSSLTLDVTKTATADCRLVGDRLLERLSTGTNPSSYFADEVTVTYAPADVNRRELALVKLVKLELEFNGKKSESVGDYSMTSVDYQSEKDKIILGLRQWGIV